MKPNRPKTPGRKTPARFASPNKDPIVVYCRIRPLFGSDPVCLTRRDNKTVVLSGTNSLSKGKTSVHSFSYVFGEETTQKELFDHVALPLVQDLLQGYNGLLFTYGVTSSGKTYTMTGTPEDGGLLPRSLDVIFNSISDYQAEKYIFKPNRVNGFEIQSSEEAFRDRLKEPSYVARTPKPKGRDINRWNNRIPDCNIIEDICSDMRYSVFISYVEIYNNYVYDLLEDISDDSLRKRNFTSKQIRKDSNNNMYVYEASVNEAKTVDEALELFMKGQVRRKVAITALNSESSRSHSVFTIRVVQAPLDDLGQNIVEDDDKVIISQLSLVDLAGSERARRTNIVSHKNKSEAGNINSSLMHLRACIEALRNSQKSNGSAQKVQYRDSKLTHLFSTFFEGEGKIRMVLCVNPREDDYIENTHVLMFAEMTQEVEIVRSTPIATPQGRTGRGNMYREAVKRAMEHGLTVAEVLAPVVYSLPEFPVDLLENSDDEESCDMLLQFLDEYIARKVGYWQDVHRRQADFRSRLTEIDKENADLRNSVALLEKDLKARNEQVHFMERELVLSGDQVNNLERQMTEVKHRLGEKDEMISQLRHENREIRSENHENRAKMQEKLANEKDKMKRIMERRLAEKQAELEGKLCFSGEKFRLLREILNAGEWDDLIDMNGPPLPSAGLSTVPSDSSVPQTRSKKRSSASESSVTEVKMTISRSSNDLGKAAKKVRSHRSREEIIPVSKNEFDSLFAKENKPPSSSQRSIAIANLRHRRTSSSGDVWVEHKPVGNLELGTVLQPKMKKRRSVTKLKVKDVTNKDASKYVLEHQEQDSQGDIETQLYKGDIIPSAGGGAQIVFKDVEKLRQESPPAAAAPYNFRKRSNEGLPLREIEDRCTVAVECHGVPSKVMKKK